MDLARCAWAVIAVVVIAVGGAAGPGQQGAGREEEEAPPRLAHLALQPRRLSGRHVRA
jgi:hypothetical protein